MRHPVEALTLFQNYQATRNAFMSLSSHRATPSNMTSVNSRSAADRVAASACRSGLARTAKRAHAANIWKLE